MLGNLGKLVKFPENKHNMASELSTDNGMSVRLYNPDTVPSIIRLSSPCPLATPSTNRFLQNRDLLLKRKTVRWIYFHSYVNFLENAGASVDLFVGYKEEHPEPHRKHSSIQPGNTDTLYS